MVGRALNARPYQERSYGVGQQQATKWVATHVISYALAPQGSCLLSWRWPCQKYVVTRDRP
jgi:hypothetical protein